MLVDHRIIGFREYIYTQPLGGMASVMASSETAFGTIYQRTLADPLRCRMHYGHPDFFDTLRGLSVGLGGKIQLADAIIGYAQRGLVEIFLQNCRRFDCGSVNVFMNAAIYKFKKRCGRAK